ncbi:MAG TPA: PAS domain S-box protein [Chthoniobacterales bacterium]|jgi:PAS domain S-box-containing protein|nr:PAS domain S-box protein [Chthoniobacterales bacterium]
MSKSSFIPADLLYEAIVQSSDDAIVSKNLQSIVMSWNKGAERIFGYSAEEMIGQSIVKLLPPDRLDEENHILSRLHKGERLDHFETRRQRKDGRIIDVSLTISPIRDSSGIIVGAAKIARDITPQKEAEAALRRADHFKNEFLTTLSHELRTPLNAILGWVQVLKETPEDCVSAIPVIERNVNVQAQLIEDLLDLSRIEAGKLSLDIMPIDLGAIVTSGMETVRPAATAKGIRLTSAFASVSGTVMGDKDRMQQIVWNLLTNAIKFTPRGGRVHVVIHRVNSHVEICVTDTGEGIAPDFLGLVFDRFRQGDGGTTRRHGGLGVGLSIVKHLTELHGGNVRVTSEGRGLGATFCVTLPLQTVRHQPDSVAAEARQAEIDANRKAIELKDIRVMVVDDEEDSISAVKKMLERHGAEVCATSSMNQALEEFPTFSPDVVLSDIGMPDHDGYELLARLRELPGGRSVPVVALTALARNEDRARAMRAGFQIHMAKPVDFPELVAVVHNLAALRAK